MINYPHTRRSAWLPDTGLGRLININMAVKRYCIACGGRAYDDYCITHRRFMDKISGRPAYVDPAAAEAFDAPIKAELKRLYLQFWRTLPMANGYPRNEPLNLGLIPPSVIEFKEMLRMIQGAERNG